jgi:hypothetical protein
MPLHIFLGDEVLLYFFVRVQVIKIQIWFEFKLVCNLQKGSKICKWFCIFLRVLGRIPAGGPVDLLSRTAQLASVVAQQFVGRTPVYRTGFDLITTNPTR